MVVNWPVLLAERVSIGSDLSFLSHPYITRIWYRLLPILEMYLAEGVEGVPLRSFRSKILSICATEVSTRSKMLREVSSYNEKVQTVCVFQLLPYENPKTCFRCMATRVLTGL